MKNRHSGLIHFTTVWLALVMFVYPIPHTIALRNMLLLVGCVILCVFLRPVPRLPALPTTRTATFILGLLTIWLVAQSALFSLAPHESFSALRGDWLIALIAMLLGILTASVVEKSANPEEVPSRLITAVVAAGLAHLIGLLLYQLWFFFSHGAFLWGRTPFAEKDYHSVIANFLLALLLAETVFRMTSHQRYLRLSNKLLSLALLVTGISTVTLLARNGVIVAVILVTAASIAFAMRVSLSRTLLLRLTLVASITAGLTAWSVAHDGRWSNFLESSQIATQIDTHRHWLQSDLHPPPHTQNGELVEGSAYLRVAWATAALREIARHPLGVGYGHKAFGIAVNDHYGLHTGLESSHSGLLDFTLANGIPGLVLWLALAGVLMLLGWRAFRAGNPVGLMLFLFVLGYLVRCALDGHLSGWRLESYALTTGLLTALTLRLQKT